MVKLLSYDWPKAAAHVTEVRQEIEGLARVSPLGAQNSLLVTVWPLEDRYRKGERSAELYEAMMGLKFREG